MQSMITIYIKFNLFLNFVLILLKEGQKKKFLLLTINL